MCFGSRHVPQKALLRVFDNHTSLRQLGHRPPTARLISTLDRGLAICLPGVAATQGAGLVGLPVVGAGLGVRRSVCLFVDYVCSSDAVALSALRGDVVEVETWFQAEGRLGARRDWVIRSSETGHVYGSATRWAAAGAAPKCILG
jgi:Acyl-ACP thioesterase